MKTNKFIQLLQQLKNNIFVDKYNCINCNKELNSISRNGLCVECSQKIEMIGDNFCIKCGRVQSNEAEYCLTCQNYTRHFDVAMSCCVYEGMAKNFVYQLKFGGKRYIAKYLGNMMADKLIDNNWDCDFIIPVPLSKKRYKKRGYNQSYLLAKNVSTQLKIPIDSQCLIKVIDNKEQAYLSGKERELNVINAYKILDEGAIKDKNIILVDDVITTGATTSYISDMLYKAKAKSVKVLTFCSARYKVIAESPIDNSSEPNI